jgi:hypothetical protein
MSFLRQKVYSQSVNRKAQFADYHNGMTTIPFHGFFTLCFSVVFLFATDFAHANDKPPIAYPVPSKFFSPNGLYTLVLVPPRSDDPKLKENADQTEIRNTYPSSGLYSTNDTTKTRWAVEWFDYEAFPADDGIHVVRIHGENALWRHYPSGTRLADDAVREQLAAPAVSFYANGEKLRTYTVRELVTKPDDLPQTMKYILWMAGATITRDGKQFVLMTQDARQIFFDLQTGMITENREAGLGNAKVWVVRLSLGVVLTTLIITMSLYLYALNKKSVTQS